jgi:hypothetical protein
VRRKISYYQFIPIAFIIAVVISACNTGWTTKSKVKIPPLSPKYGYRDKQPMGSFMAYHYINSLFPSGYFEVKDKSVSQHGYELYGKKSLYIIIARAVFLSRSDIKTLMRYVENGNTAFISAEYIDQRLTDTLGIDMYTDFSSMAVYNEYKLPKNDTWATVRSSSGNNKEKFGIFYFPFTNNFSSADSVSLDSSGVQLLGHNEFEKENFIAVNHGSGKFIFHAAPVTFSNYFLLNS